VQVEDFQLEEVLISEAVRLTLHGADFVVGSLMIDPGDTWDDTIQSKLADADVVIILASVAALSTDYITDHEIPKALELHNTGQTVVVPVVLEKCRWDKTALGPLNALPEKARPLTDWNPRADGWYTIAGGLAKVLRKLMEKGVTKKREINRSWRRG